MGVRGPQERHLSLSPPGHTDEELNTVQKPDLITQEGWFAVAWESQVGLYLEEVALCPPPAQALTRPDGYGLQTRRGVRGQSLLSAY